MTLKQGLAHRRGSINISGMMNKWIGRWMDPQMDTPTIPSMVKCIKSHKKYKSFGEFRETEMF